MINILEAFDIRVTWQISSFLGKGTVGENSGVFTRNAGKGNTNSFYLRHFKTDWALCIFFQGLIVYTCFSMLYHNEIGRVYKHHAKDEVFKS